MYKFHSELIGIFFLTIVIGLTANPLGTGFVLAALIYCASDLSGSHFNPAVSLAAWITDEISSRQFTSYLIAQCLGATAGALFVWWISDNTHTNQPGQGTGTFEFIAVEFIFSLIFVLVFLFLMYPYKKRRNPVFGLVIGLTFAGCYIISEPIAGTGLNPALALAYIFTDSLNHGYTYYYLPAYILSPLIGGLGAAYLYKKVTIPSEV